jgi:hypothetical protein
MFLFLCGKKILIKSLYLKKDSPLSIIMVNNNQYNPQNLDMKLGNEIPSQDYNMLAAIVNSAWEWLFRADEGVIEKRLESGHIFIAAYGPKEIEDSFDGLDLGRYDNRNIPLVFLETIALNTEGNHENIPKDYFSLTDGGFWGSKPDNPDTIVMVDLTGNPVRKRVTKEVSALINYAKSLIGGELEEKPQFDVSEINHIWTYSPDRQGVLKMHLDNGATDTGFKIKNSRVPLDFVLMNNGVRTIDPGYKHPLMDTHVMSYKN